MQVRSTLPEKLRFLIMMKKIGKSYNSLDKKKTATATYYVVADSVILDVQIMTNSQ